MLASIYKRAHDARDFSRAIPGHGGFLDRFDSLLLTGALIGPLSIFRFFPVLMFATRH